MAKAITADDIVPKGTKRLTREQEIKLFSYLEAERERVERAKGTHHYKRAAKYKRRVDRVYQIMVELNMGLVHSYLHRQNLTFPELYDDLAQEGVFGIYKAVDKYDHKKGFRFSTYASWWIKANVDRAYQKEGLHRTSPIAGGQRVYSFGRYGTERQNVTSLDVPLKYDDEDATLGDVIADNKVVIEDEIVEQELIWFVNRCAKRVTERIKNPVAAIRFKKIFTDRLLTEDPKTLSEMGKEEGVSRERIRQVEVRMKELLAADLVKRGYEVEFTA